MFLCLNAFLSCSCTCTESDLRTKDHLRRIAHNVCEGEGGLQVPGTQLGTSQPFLSYFSSGLKCLLCTLSSLLPGTALPARYCVLSVLIHVPLTTFDSNAFLGHSCKIPILGLRVSSGWLLRWGRWTTGFLGCSERHDVQLSLWAVTISFDYVRVWVKVILKL